MKQISILLAVLIYTTSTQAQQKFDYSTKVQMNGREVTLEQFKGKPMLLDLFSNSCTICFKTMPKMGDLQKEFKEKINIVYLGNDKVKLPKAYDVYKRKFGLETSAVFSKELFEIFDVGTVPYYYWIDAEGNIRGKTSLEKVSSGTLTAFLEGDYSFLKTIVQTELSSSELVPNESLNSISRTVFTAKNDSFKYIAPPRLAITEKNPSVRVINMPLSVIFNLAYWGRSLIISTDFDVNDNWNLPVSDGDSLVDRLLNERFCYGMAFDGYRSTAFLQEVLRNDLKFHFGLEATKMEQLMPVWTLQRKDTSSQFLRHHSAKIENNNSFGGISMVGGSIYELLRNVQSRHQELGPMIDETGITWLIDLELQAAMTDFEDVRNALAKKGLLLTKKYRPMQVIKVRCVNRTVAAARLPQQ